MDANTVYRLVVTGISLVVIGTAAVRIYHGNYLAALEQEKQRRAMYIRLYDLIFVILAWACLDLLCVRLEGIAGPIDNVSPRLCRGVCSEGSRVCAMKQSLPTLRSGRRQGKRTWERWASVLTMERP